MDRDALSNGVIRGKYSEMKGLLVYFGCKMWLRGRLCKAIQGFRPIVQSKLYLGLAMDIESNFGKNLVVANFGNSPICVSHPNLFAQAV